MRLLRILGMGVIFSLFVMFPSGVGMVIGTVIFYGMAAELMNLLKAE